MSVDRRDLIKLLLGTTVAGSVVGRSKEARGEKGSKESVVPQVACLVDTTLCIGCRKCEDACNRSNRLPRPKQPFSDRHVLRERRRPNAAAFTVVNSYPEGPSRTQLDRDETFVKFQCMHCLDPACVSACIVGALTKTEAGPVVYDADKCIGCRYCMIACPFEIPAYEYLDPTTPRVRKCTFCVDEQQHNAANPACAMACPVEAIVFGERSSLLELAHRRIEGNPARYRDHVYGEYEVGGTSWLYLTGRPLAEIDLLELPDDAPPRLTEAIQHGIFNYGAAPLAFYGGLAGLMWFTSRRNKKSNDND